MLKIAKHKPFLIFIVVFGLLFFLHSVRALEPLENFLLGSLKPLNSGLYSWGNSLNRSYAERQSQGDLSAQVASLRSEVAQLLVERASWQEIDEENKKLRQQLNFLSTNKFQTLSAKVLARETLAESSGMSGSLVIDKGSQAGLRVGLGVISPEGVIIGKIIDLKDTSAEICLATSPECKLAAAIQNQNKTQGLTDGDLGLTIRMSYIPQLEKISPGDIVVTSGLGDSIPRGLLIGKVVQVHSASNEVWQEATIESPLNLNDLTIVAVVIP